MVNLTSHPEGVFLPVRAQPGARSDGIRGEHNGALKVAVTQVAEKGKANRALVQALAKSLGLKRSQIQLVAGETDRDKRFLIRDITPADLAARLAAISGPAPSPPGEAR
jgi:uncharacterized protein (TIGR00251 family)